MAGASTKIRRAVKGSSGRFKIKRESIASQQADLLRHVRAREGLSRVELARILSLAPSTVGIYVDHLVEQGFLFEGKARERDFGRPPTILALNPQGGRFIGVDFEARNIMAVAVDFSQRTLQRYHDTIAVGESVENILRKIERAIEAVSRENGLKILGIGVSVPGVIDPVKGVASSYKHIAGWENVPIAQRLKDKFNVPVFLENNIRGMALAELWFGHGRGVKNFVCVGVRSGIGAGIVIDGRIYHGSRNRAGEIGDWPCATWEPDARGELVATGITRIEEVASFKSAATMISARPSQASSLSLVAPGTDLPLDAFIEAAHADEPSVLEILDRAARVFALAFTQLNCAFNPEKIIIAGVFTAFGDLFLNRVKAHLDVFAAPAIRPVVVNSTLGEYNGALGAAALAVHEWKPETKPGL
jgi:glucokinase